MRWSLRGGLRGARCSKRNLSIGAFAVEPRHAGKSQFSALACVATVAAGGRVTFYANDLARAVKDIVRASKKFGVYVKIERDDKNECLRVSP
jgi:hypothetical protein